MYRNHMQRPNCNCGCNCNSNDMQNLPCDCDLNNDNHFDNCYQCACSDVANYESNYDSCGCGFDEENNFFPVNPMYAQSYVPFQTLAKVFIPCVGLKMGTIFPELVSPYMPGQSQREIEYIRNTNQIKKGCNG